MAFSKEKAFDRAERFAAKGQHDKAAREYQAIVDNDPKEIRAWLMLADCLVRCGDAPRAIERYLQVGGYYIQQKDHQKALAVYRQVLNLDASRIDVQLRVAALNRELGRIQDAVAMYERVAGLQLQAGKTVDALQTYKVVADADPTAVSRRLRLAELYSRERRVPEAVVAFRQAGEHLLAQGRKGDYVRVAERLLYHDANDLQTVRRLAAVYLDLGDPRRALMKLNGLLHADAADREGIELLAQTFMSLGKPDKAASAIGELARSLREAGSDEELAEAARVLRLGLSWVPGHPDLVQALGHLEGRDMNPTPDRPTPDRPTPDGPTHAVAQAESEPLEVDDMDVVELHDDDVEDGEFDSGEYEASGTSAVPIELEPVESIDSAVVELDTASGPAPTLTRSVLSEALESGTPGDTDALTDFDKILFEARVYIKYRLFEHALDHVSVALQQQPEHVGALSLQARALTELGRTVEAADTHAHVARRVIDSDPKLAREHVMRALNLAPGHVEALQAEEMLQRDDGPADEVSIAAPLSRDPFSEVAPTELLRVDTSREMTANLLEIDHGGDGAEDGAEDGEEEDFPIEVDLADEPSEEIAVSAPLEIEDRFGLDPASDDDNLLLYDDANPTGEFPATPVAPDLELDEEGLGADAAQAFDELTAEVSEYGERGLAGIDLLEPSVDTGMLQLNDHAEPRGGLRPASAALAPDEPDLVGLAIGKDQARALVPDRPEPAWPDISDDVAEVRFFIDQGLDDDAEAAVEDLKRRHPGHPALAVFDEPPADEPDRVPVERGASTPLIALDPSADEPDDDDDDAYLSAIFSDPAPAKNPTQRTRGARVATQDVDAQSSFDLGVAYREMGLVDQAVEQFEAACAEPSVRVRALVMLGTMRLQQGNAAAAVESLEEAVQLATNSDEAAEANYELGVVYEKIGDTDRAIARLSAVTAGYRDRDERLDLLQG